MGAPAPFITINPTFFSALKKYVWYKWNSWKSALNSVFLFFFVFCSCNSYPQIFVWIATIVWPLYRLAKIEILQLNGIRNTKIISYILWTKKKTVSIDENAPNSKSFFLFHSAKLRPQKTSYGRTHMVLYVTPSDVPYRRS